jgi:hypothetical protein
VGIKKNKKLPQIFNRSGNVAMEHTCFRLPKVGQSKS